MAMSKESRRSPAHVEVAVLAPAEGTFTYRVPEALLTRVVPGMRLLVPFGRRRLTGIAMGAPAEGKARAELRDVEDVLDDVPALPPRLLDLLRWISSYYLHPIGPTLRAALPPTLVAASRRTIGVTPAGREALRAGTLSDEQARTALQSLARRGGMVEGRFVRAHGRALLDRLVDGGWASRDERVHGGSASMQVLWRASVEGEGLQTALAQLARRAPRRAEALARLAREGPIASAALAPGVSAEALRALEKAGLAARAQVEATLDPFLGERVARDAPPPATVAQAEAVKAIMGALTVGKFETFLLYGKTGSGKTEVYLRVIGAALARGSGAVVLVPEIALTPQLVRRFRARLGDRVAVQHSGLSDRERGDQWRRIRRGELPVVIGARSAVLAPLEHVGAIIVDEEHEGSYKQEENLLYHARDVAVMRAKLESAVVVLGSATPSIESFHNAERGRYHRLDLPERVMDRPLPHVALVDLRAEKRERGAEPTSLSRPLCEALTATVARGEQAILFLNRRGFATFVFCRDCGHTARCPNCDMSLVLHRAGPVRGLRCHACDHREPPPERCAKCGGPASEARGLGTQRVEAEVREAIAGVRTARLDRDTTTRRGALEAILAELREGRVDVLIGTQMVAKGHDFPGVTLVGVISAEASLQFPDFRAPERTFQLLTQVAGRAGRGDRPGLVLVQTLEPDHPCLTHVLSHDYAGFYREEILHRREPGWPPFRRLVNLRISSPSAQGAEVAAARCADAARRAISAEGAAAEGVEALGPAPAIIARVRNRWRWQLLLRGPSPGPLRRVAQRVLAEIGRRAGVVVDVDPGGML